MRVHELLTRSLAAHELARGLRNSGRRAGRRGDAQAVLALTRARDLRLQALSEDPDQADPAWDAERVPHAEMMSWYSEQIP